MSNPNPAEKHPRESDPHDPREGLWDPERDKAPARRQPVSSGPRKRALPRSWVSKTLWLLIALVVIAALLGVFE